MTVDCWMFRCVKWLVAQPLPPQLASVRTEVHYVENAATAKPMWRCKSPNSGTSHKTVRIFNHYIVWYVSFTASGHVHWFVPTLQRPHFFPRVYWTKYLSATARQIFILFRSQIFFTLNSFAVPNHDSLIISTHLPLRPLTWPDIIW